MRLRRLGYFIIDNWPALLAIAGAAVAGILLARAFVAAVILGE